MGLFHVWIYVCSNLGLLSILFAILSQIVFVVKPVSSSPAPIFFPTYTTTGFSQRTIDLYRDGLTGGYIVHTRRDNITIYLQSTLGRQFFIRVMYAEGPLTDSVEIHNDAHGPIIGKVTPAHEPQQKTFISTAPFVTVRFWSRSNCTTCPTTHFKLLFTTVREATLCNRGESMINNTYCMPNEASCIATAYKICKETPDPDTGEFRTIFTDTDIVIVVFGFAAAILVGAGSSCIWIKLRSNRCIRRRRPQEGDDDEYVQTVSDQIDLSQMEFDENGHPVPPKPPPYTASDPPPYSSVDNTESHAVITTNEPEVPRAIPPDYDNTCSEQAV